MSEQKRILYIITKGNFGGAQRYVFELALASKAAGADVAVACGAPGLLTEKLSAHGIQYIPLEAFQRDISIFKEVSALFTLVRLFRFHKPDVVHLNSSKAGVLGSLAARIARVPRIIFTAHGWPFLERRSRTWRAMAWLGSYLTTLLAHKVIVVSEHDRTVAHMPGTQKKLAVIHTAVPPFALKSRMQARDVLFDTDTQRAHKDSLWMVTIAELTPNKNLTSAIKAVSAYNAMHSQKVFYTVIGEGEQRDELTTLIASLNMQAYVHLAGYQEDARVLLKAFDVFKLPSHKEGLPYALLEAGAAELGVIASNVGGIPEVVVHKKMGLLCDPRDLAEMTKHIETLTNSEIRKHYARSLKEHVAHSFALEHMIEHTFMHYTTPLK